MWKKFQEQKDNLKTQVKSFSPLTDQNFFLYWKIQTLWCQSPHPDWIMGAKT